MIQRYIYLKQMKMILDETIEYEIVLHQHIRKTSL